jgi:hypothetical protein
METHMALHMALHMGEFIQLQTKERVEIPAL